MTHRFHQLTKQFTRAALLALLLAGLAPFSFAQSAAQPAAQTSPAANLYSVRITHVKPGLEREYRTFIQNESLPAHKKGGVKLLSTATATQFGELGEFISVQPIASVKQFDEPSPLRKALGDEGFQSYAERWERLIVDSRACLMQVRPDLSANLPKPGTPPTKFGIGITLTIAPGRLLDFENYVKTDTLPILQKAYPKGVVISKVLLGGDTNVYRVLLYVDSYAELESSGQAAAAAGFAKALTKGAGIVLHTETNVYRYLPELSIRPEAQK